MKHPKARAINHPALAPQTARGFRFPVVKPDVGGSGAGIMSFSDENQLAEAAADGSLDFGPDGSALVQEHLPARDDHVHRVEILGDRYLTASRSIWSQGRSISARPTTAGSRAWPTGFQGVDCRSQHSISPLTL